MPVPVAAATPKRKLARKARARWTGADDPPPLLGLRLICVRAMTSAEVATEGWDYHPHTCPVALVFEDGSVVFAAKNPYGDGGCGVLVGNTRLGKPFQLRSVPEGYRLTVPPPWPREGALPHANGAAHAVRA